MISSMNRVRSRPGNADSFMFGDFDAFGSPMKLSAALTGTTHSIAPSHLVILATFHCSPRRRYWRDRDKEIRVLAERSTHPQTKRTLQNIAADYENLAQRAEERLRESRREKR
jgi:hypothetical protein